LALVHVVKPAIYVSHVLFCLSGKRFEVLVGGRPKGSLRFGVANTLNYRACAKQPFVGDMKSVDKHQQL
jgi:hypothetical protein